MYSKVFQKHERKYLNKRRKEEEDELVNEINVRKIDKECWSHFRAFIFMYFLKFQISLV